MSFTIQFPSAPVPPVHFKCRVTQYSPTNHRPVAAEFDVLLADGTRERFTKTSTFEIETIRNRLTRQLAKR